MTKKSASVIVSLVLLTLLLSSCKLPASQAPTETGEAMTTPINIQNQLADFFNSDRDCEKTSPPRPLALGGQPDRQPQIHRNPPKSLPFPR